MAVAAQRADKEAVGLLSALDYQSKEYLHPELIQRMDKNEGAI